MIREGFGAVDIDLKPGDFEERGFDYGDHRRSFPALENKLYFNHGGQGVMAWGVLQAIAQTYIHLQNIGPFSQESNAWSMVLIQKLRNRMALELGVHPNTLTLTENVSAGCNIALWGMPWRSGDHILLSDCEHPSVVAVVQELQRRFGVRASTFNLVAALDRSNPTETLTQNLQPNTRLVVVSHVLWNTGHLLPLKALVTACQNFSEARQPVRVLVDGAQSVGMLPLDLQDLGADFYAFTSHKWWCGPEGVGGLYVSPQAMEELQPTFGGWRGITQDAQGQPTGWHRDGRRYEVATSPYPLYGGLLEALNHQARWGNASQRYERIRSLSQSLWQQLQGIEGITCIHPVPPKTGLVCFTLANRSPQSLVQYLEQRHIYLRTLANPSCARACTHYLNTEGEVNQLVAAIAEFMAAPPP
jgi:L-cysteine/cystine lyase